MRLRPAIFAALSCAAFSCGGGSSSGTPGQPGGPDMMAANGPPVITPQADYLIVTASTLSESAQRYKSYRESTGHTVAFATSSSILAGETDSNAAAMKIREHVKAQYAARDQKRPFFVLVIGDAEGGKPVDDGHVPTGQYMEPFDGSMIATDNIYADMDGDHIPDLAVGRIPVSSNDDVDLVLGKTKAYESTYEVGAWNRRLNLFASTSGFGDVIDKQIETLVFSIVEEIPYDYDITLTYANQASPYVYVPEKFSDKVYDRVNEGSLMMAYVGHGSEDSFATLDWNGKSFPILDTTQLGKVDVHHKPPLLTLIACLTGAFDSGDSISEQILRSKNGPVGILSSTEVSHPYANAIFIRELAQGLTASKDKTAGELFIDAKRRMLKGDDALRHQIDMQVGQFVTAEQQAALKRSHQYMYTLFGDPAARLAYPKTSAKVTAPTAKVAPGANASVTVTFDGGVAKGQAHVTLEGKRSTVFGTIKPVPADSDATRDAVITANYTTANNRILAEKTATYEAGSLTTTLTVPAGTAAGDYYVKVYADDGKTDAVGSAKLSVGP
jgi:hypothetical protein